MLASHSCSLLVFFEKSPLGIKLGTKARAHRFGIQKRHCYQFLTELTLIKHRHTSRHHTFQHVHSGHVHEYSVTLDNQLFFDRKERNVRVSQADVHRICHQTLHYVDISFFSLLLYILAIIMIQSKHIVSGKRPYILHLSFSKSILNYAPNTVASYSFIFISQCCFSNCASWCA